MNEQLHAVSLRITALRQKLAARDGKPGLEKNCEAIRSEIAKLEAITLKPTTDSDGTDGA